MTEGFQPARTIASVLADIGSRQLILPAIQREFVWGDSKICSLFDSLMRGYPIGGFLFWRVSDETVKQHTFYGFIRNFDQRPPNNVCPKIDDDVSPSDSRFAILDGQQRLTSLNIGLRGSHTVKLANKWWDNPDAFPKRSLYLDLAANGVGSSETGSDDETGDVNQFTFRFRTADQAASENAAGRHWMLVRDIYDLREMSHLMAYAATKQIGNDPQAITILSRLHEITHTRGTISPFVESEQDIDRVMNIFIRVNAQGEPLSFADLLLSQATAAWTTDEGGEPVDAREEIRSFNDHLNRADRKFDFKRDQIMKSCLLLTDAGSVRFQIENYGRDQMIQIRQAWPAIKRSLDLAASLLEQFGLTAENLNARSVIHPLAYYIKRRDLDASYLTAVAHASDRELVRQWVVRSLLRQGTWGSGLDTLLTRLRQALRDFGGSGFPAQEIDQAMADLGKSLAFDEDSVQGLLRLKYGDKNCFPLLSLIYPSADSSRRHIDHVFPQTLFTRAKLQKAGFSQEAISRMIQVSQEIPNLQLLTAAENQSKGGMVPFGWLDQAFPDPTASAAIRALHHLGTGSDDLSDFEQFTSERRVRLAAVVRQRLGVVASPTPTV